MTKTDPLIKSKAFAISAIMDDKNLSKIIEDSFSAPAGSTKNNRAKAILKSLHKVNSNFQYANNDGQGGYGDTQNPFASILQPKIPFNVNKNSSLKFIKTIDPFINNDAAKLADIKNIIANNPNEWGHAADAIDAKYGKGTATKYDSPEYGRLLTTAYTERPTTFISSNPQAESIKKSLTSFNEFINPPTTIENVSRISGALRGLSKGIGLAGELPVKIAKVFYPFGKGMFEYKFNQPFETGKYLFDPSRPEYKVAGIINPGLPAKADSNIVSISPDQTTKIKEIIDKVPVTGNGLDWSKAASDLKIAGIDPSSVEADTALRTKYGGKQPLDQSSLKVSMDNIPTGVIPPSTGLPTATELPPVAYPPGSIEAERQAAYNAGLGPTGFMLQETADMKSLFKKLGIPDMVGGYFPAGMTSLTIGSLEDAVNKEYKITEQLNNIQAKKKAGMTIENDLTSYIRDKDEYLGKVDKLIDDTQTTMVNADLSDPNVRERYNNYLNYLTILKGRQNQRYAGFLKTSIDEWNAELENDADVYTASLNAAEKRIKSGTETITNIQNMVKEFYGQLEKMEDRQMKITDWTTNNYKANVDILTSVFRLKELQSGGGTTKISETDALKLKVPLGTTWNQLNSVDMIIKALQDRTDLNNDQRAKGVSDYITQAELGSPLLWNDYVNEQLNTIDWNNAINSKISDAEITDLLKTFWRSPSAEKISAIREKAKNAILNSVKEKQAAKISDKDILDSIDATTILTAIMQAAGKTPTEIYAKIREISGK